MRLVRFTDEYGSETVIDINTSTGYSVTPLNSHGALLKDGDKTAFYEISLLFSNFTLNFFADHPGNFKNLMHTVFYVGGASENGQIEDFSIISNHRNL